MRHLVRSAHHRSVFAHARARGESWELRHNLSFYDGLYVALAERLDAPLLTLDSRLARAAGASTDIKVLTASA